MIQSLSADEIGLVAGGAETAAQTAAREAALQDAREDAAISSLACVAGIGATACRGGWAAVFAGAATLAACAEAMKDIGEAARLEKPVGLFSRRSTYA